MYEYICHTYMIYYDFITFDYPPRCASMPSCRSAFFFPDLSFQVPDDPVCHASTCWCVYIQERWPCALIKCAQRCMNKH